MAISNSKEIIDGISKALFEAEYRRLKGRVKELSRMNREALPTTVYPFMYQGKVYIPEDVPHLTAGPGSSVGLAFSLYPQMTAFLADKNTVEQDRKQIEMMLFKLTYQVCNMQELRDTLPDCLVSLVPQLDKMPRCMDQKFLIRNDERTLRQFEVILPKMEFYSVARLMY
jgi:hypothetical protein